MNSFQSLLKFIGQVSAMGFALLLVALIVLFPFVVAILVGAFILGIYHAYERRHRGVMFSHAERPSRSATRRRAVSGKKASIEGLKSEKATEGILLSNGTRFENPEGRIREYCDIEMYRGYDDRHSADDKITAGDVAAANDLYAMIDLYDPTESSRIVGAMRLERALAAVPDVDLADLDEQAWASLAPKLRLLLGQFLSIRGVGLAKATKILHLKRPSLFPVLDSFVARFLSGIDLNNHSDKRRLVELGLHLMNVTREDLRRNRAQFRRLGEQLRDMPIKLTPVRMYDVLCWTQEKWVNRGNTHAEYGTAVRSL